MITAPFARPRARRVPDHRRHEHRPAGDLLANWPQSARRARRRCCWSRRWSPALLLRLTGARRAVAAETGLLMASPSETTLIVLGAAAAARLISAGDRRLLADRDRDRADHDAPARQLGRRCGAAGRAARRATVADDAAPTAGRTVIFGFGRVGRMVAEMLDATAGPISRSIATSTRSPARARQGYRRAVRRRRRGPNSSSSSSSARPARWS